MSLIEEIRVMEMGLKAEGADFDNEEWVILCHPEVRQELVGVKFPIHVDPKIPEGHVYLTKKQWCIDAVE